MAPNQAMQPTAKFVHFLCCRCAPLSRKKRTNLAASDCGVKYMSTDYLISITLIGVLYALPALPVLVNNLWSRRDTPRSSQVWLAQVFISLGICYVFVGMGEVLTSVARSASIDCLEFAGTQAACAYVYRVALDGVLEYGSWAFIATGLVVAYRFLGRLESKEYLTSQSSR